MPLYNSEENNIYAALEQSYRDMLLQENPAYSPSYRKKYKEVFKDVNRRRDARDMYGPGGSPDGSGRGQAQQNRPKTRTPKYKDMGISHGMRQS